MQFPERVGHHPVVAFTHTAAPEGERDGQGVAITKDREGLFNVHTVWLADCNANRWEGLNGRYGIRWNIALGEMVQRAVDKSPA